jgi:ABC-type glycerol-3-phosphate transport system permease component
MRMSDRLYRGVIFTVLAASAVVVLLPFLWMVSTSLKPDLRAVYQFPPQWIPNPIAWENYLKAWNSAPFSQYLFNSVFTSVTVVAIQLINGCLCAYAFSWLKFPGRDWLFLLFLAVLMVPNEVTIVPNYVTLSRAGALNSYWALIVPFTATAFGTFLIRQAFLQVPSDLVDAAVVDGASHLQILRHVMIPLSIPTLLTFMLLNFSWRWNDYFWVLIVTNSDALRTLPVGVVAMRAGPEGGSNWHYMMAATVIVLLPILALFIAAQRYFVEGISRTGLRGG